MHAKMTTSDDAQSACKPPIEVTEHIVNETDGHPFRLIVISNPASLEYNNKMQDNTERECFFAGGEVIGTKSKCRSIRLVPASQNGWMILLLKQERNQVKAACLPAGFLLLTSNVPCCSQ